MRWKRLTDSRRSLHQDVGRRHRGEAQVGGVNLFPIMPPARRSPGQFVAASCMFMARYCGRPAGGAGGGSGPETPVQAKIWCFVAVSSSLGAEMMECLSPTTSSQHSFNKSTRD